LAAPAGRRRTRRAPGAGGAHGLTRARHRTRLGPDYPGSRARSPELFFSDVAKAAMMHRLWLPTDYEGLASARIERYLRFLAPGSVAPEHPIDLLPRRAPARGLVPPCQLSHRRHGERTRPGDDRAPGCRRPGPLPLVQVADREDALRYAAVVAHVAQREDRSRVGGEVGDVRLDGGLV